MWSSVRSLEAALASREGVFANSTLVSFSFFKNIPSQVPFVPFYLPLPMSRRNPMSPYFVRNLERLGGGLSIAFSCMGVFSFSPYSTSGTLPLDLLRPLPRPVLTGFVTRFRAGHKSLSGKAVIWIY